MDFRKTKKLFRQLFHFAGADRVLIVYLIFFILTAAIILLVEPNINSFMDSIWFCFATATSIGFGDIIAVTFVGRILTIVLSIYSIAVIGIITALITSYFLEYSKIRAKDSARKFIDDIQHLDELSKEELKELSEKVKHFIENNKY